MLWFIPVFLLLLTSCSSNIDSSVPGNPTTEITGKIDIYYFKNLLLEEGVEIWSNALLFKEKNSDNKTFSGKDLELVLSKASCYDDTAYKYGLCYRKSLTNSNIASYQSLLEENKEVTINATIGEDYLELKTSGLVEITNCFKVSPDSNLDIGEGVVLNNVIHFEESCN
jgi:hypothetical protein